MNTKNKHLHTAIKLAGHSEDGTPTADQLLAINGYTLKTHGADEVYVRQFIVSHTGLDRDKEIISDNLLQNMADTLAGKGLFVKHPGSPDGESAPGVGKWFETEIKTLSLDEARAALGEPIEFAPDASTAKLLFASAYIPRIEENKGLIAKIDAGVAGYVSASFSYETESPIEKDGQVIGYFLSGKGEAREASLVWLGAQQGAQAVKSAGSNKSTTDHLNTDEDEPVLEELKAKIKTLTTEKGTVEGELTTEKAARTAAQAELQAFKDASGGLSAVAIKELVDEQAKVKAAAIDALVAADRNAGKCGDDDAAIAAAKTKYAAYPMPALNDLVAASKATDKGMQGGDPNAGRNGGAAELDDCPV